jgi:uncharacterized membrane protein
MYDYSIKTMWDLILVMSVCFLLVGLAIYGPLPDMWGEVVTTNSNLRPVPQSVVDRLPDAL